MPNIVDAKFGKWYIRSGVLPLGKFCAWASKNKLNAASPFSEDYNVELYWQLANTREEALKCLIEEIKRVNNNKRNL